MPPRKRPQRIGNKEISAFLQAQLRDSARSASTATYTLMLKLLDMPDAVAFCVKCERRRGVCRCLSQGNNWRGRWGYKSQTSTWVIDVDWLLELDVNEPKTVMHLGRTATSQRVQLLIIYLRGLPA